MMYRNFAIGTLIAAPLVVLAVQSVLPNPPEPAPTQQITPDVPPPVPVPVAPPVAPPSAAAGAPGFGQPMAEAGQPMLAPGAGLPETSTAPMVDPGQSFTPGVAPAGSPNAE
jgi:hypothetical protein